MIANAHHSTAAAFYKVREKKKAKPSTYQQRVKADRIVMLAMFLITIVFAALTA